MMKVITGRMFKTSFGSMIVHNEQDAAISVGEKISFNNDVFIVKAIIPPTTPSGKWSLRIA